MNSETLYDICRGLKEENQARDALFQRMDDIYFQETEIGDPNDTSVQTVSVAYGTNVVDLVRDLAATRTLNYQVPAVSEAKQAKQRADTLEKWCSALISLNERKQDINFAAELAWFAAQRGFSILRSLYVERSGLPMTFQVRDPAHVYLDGDLELTRVAEIWDRRVGDIQDMYPGVLSREDYKDRTAKVEWCEYWDDTVCAYWADGNPVTIKGIHQRPHLYGCVPYAVANARTTPLRAPERRYRPLLVGVEKVLENLNVLSSIIATAGMASVTSAWAVYSRRYGPDEGQRELDLTPNAINYFDPSQGEDVKPLQRASLPSDFFQLFDVFLRAFLQGTIPLSLFGESNNALAGYAINLLTQQGQRVLGPIWKSIEVAHEKALINTMHQMTGLVGPLLSKADIPLYVTAKEGGQGRLYRKEIKLKWGTLGEDFDIKCKMDEAIPADEAAKLRQGMESWKSGFLSHETALTLAGVPDATDEIDRIFVEQLYTKLAGVELESLAVERGYIPEDEARFQEKEEGMPQGAGGAGGMVTQGAMGMPGQAPGPGPGAFPPQAMMQEMAPMTPEAMPTMKEMGGEPPIQLPGMR
jgi:hypothetical protein